MAQASNVSRIFASLRRKRNNIMMLDSVAAHNHVRTRWCESSNGWPGHGDMSLSFAISRWLAAKPRLLAARSSMSLTFHALTDMTWAF